MGHADGASAVHCINDHGYFVDCADDGTNIFTATIGGIGGGAKVSSWTNAPGASIRAMFVPGDRLAGYPIP